MTTANDARKAHKILDDLFNRKPVLDEEREFLRKALPELPKQKTLEEITIHVLDTWSCTSGNRWGGDGFDPDVSIEDWLWGLHKQLQGLMNTPVTVPALPAGMRIADHKHYGRVVVSPRVGPNGRYEIFNLDPGMSSGTDISEVEPDSLTFIDSEPAKPAHPEFLETEADYENAPEGTIVARDGINSWMKEDDVWVQGVAVDATVYTVPCLKGSRRVLRWGLGK